MKTMISDWLQNAAQKLHQIGISSSRLDAELILARALGKPREWLLAHGDFELSEKILSPCQDDISRRLNREPLAYILGEKEFYGRKFAVTPDVLIPRPESEQIIEELAKVLRHHFTKAAPSATAEARKIGLSPVTTGRHPICASRNDIEGFSRTKILDIGTGSGALAITAALEFPSTRVTASDISDAALEVARQNAKKLGAEITFQKSNLLDHWIPDEILGINPRTSKSVRSDTAANSCEKFDIIIANLPYVDKDWQVSPETDHEPEIALLADDNGLDLIKKLIRQTPQVFTLDPRIKSEDDSYDSFLILEMDPRQIETAKQFAAEHNFHVVTEWPFGLVIRN